MANPNGYFEQRVNILPETGCWIWMLYVDKDGYGTCKRSGVKLMAHVASLIEHKGISPKKGQVVMHSCDIPSCVNPDHLQIGTQSQNILDSYKRGRNTQVGENNNGGHLDEERVRAIYLSEDSHVAAARKFGTTSKNVAAIRHGISWRHVTVHLVKPEYQDGRTKHRKL